LLVGGSALGQAVTVLLLPALTRLYTPSDFAVLAVFTSAVALLSVAAGLRLELAIPIPKSDEEAAQLLFLSLLVNSVSAIAALLVALAFPVPITSVLGQPALRRLLWLVPVAMWVTAVYTTLQYWHTRKRNFSAIASTRIAQAVSGTGVQLSFGLWHIAPFGLLLGQVVTNAAGLVKLARLGLAQDRALLRRVSGARMRAAMRAYGAFPKYSTFEALTNAASMQLPFMLISAFGTVSEAGHLLLASRVIGGPMSLIGMAVSQVFFSRASDEHRSGQLGRFTGEILSILYKFGVGPILFIGLTAPFLFPLLFGDRWSRAGVIVLWMTPSFFLQFLVSPISMVPHVKGRQADALWLQVLGLVLRVGGVAAAAALGHSPRIVEAYAISSTVFYVVYLCAVGKMAHVSISAQKIREGTRVCAAWVAAAGLTAWALSQL
jgi:O-antigen/teichoic acid export membrane protein